ncbi:MAG: hypothetical protein WBX25_07540 [Rhodomicrobium sp.]
MPLASRHSLLCAFEVVTYGSEVRGYSWPGSGRRHYVKARSSTGTARAGHRGKHLAGLHQGKGKYSFGAKIKPPASRRLASPVDSANTWRFALRHPNSILFSH